MKYTVFVNSEGEIWCQEGTEIYHRENGPAIIYTNGDQEWWINGQLHRTDGPAFIRYGSEHWFNHGRLHREDGPAYIEKNGYQEWYLHGVKYSEQEFLRKTQPATHPCANKVVEIDGVKYTLIPFK